MVFINNDIQNIILDILDNCDIDIQDLIYYYEKKNIINETISILGNIYNSLPENIENLICDEIDKHIYDDSSTTDYSDDSDDYQNDIDNDIETDIEIKKDSLPEQNIQSSSNSFSKKNHNIDVNDDEVNFKKLMSEIPVLDKSNIKVLDSLSVKLSDNDISYYNSKIDILDSIPQPEQRSDEWYEYRNGMLTASDLGIAISKQVGTKNALIVRKCGLSKNTSSGSAACRWGIKYEPISTEIYEKRNNIKIIDYGCIQHQSFKIFGASPDGVVGKNSGNLTGRMLEIKNPISREITGIPPWNYWAQMQGQMEVADLDYCDFLECKTEEYESEEAFYNDGNEILTQDGLEKGVIMNLLEEDTNNIIHKYCPLGLNEFEIKNWIDNEFDDIISKDNITFLNLTWWKLVKYSCILIKRDKVWFEKAKPLISEFWDRVLYHRENGCDTILPKKKIKKVNEESKKCLIIDSDDDDNNSEKSKLNFNCNQDDILERLNNM